MTESDYWQLDPNAEVKILGTEEFAERYIGVVALNDTVLVANVMAGLPGKTYSVIPYDEERQRECWERLPDRLKGTHPPRVNGPIPREEAARKVWGALEKQARLDDLNRSGRLRRAAHMVRYLLGKDSAWMPSMEAYHSRLPEILIFHDDNHQTTEVVIHEDAERRAAALH